MATKTKAAATSELKDGPLTKGWNTAWNALQPIRSTWDEKEQALMAQTNDSVSGNITPTRVSDAALSTLSYERQARVAAQLPTGRCYAMSKADNKKAQILNIVLNRYILPNADDQFDMLVKLRMWGVYASVYGSMPMFYDYRVDREGGYIGPTCYLVDPRCFAISPGYSSVQEAPAVYVSTIMSRDALEQILNRKTTSYDKAAIRKLLSLMKDQGKNKPAKINDSNKQNSTVQQRYDLSNVEDQVEIVNEYRNDRWLEYAPDFQDQAKGDDLVIRDMDNPHKSGRKPVVMRHCFPLLGSIFGLGDFERGMKVQKAKDSILNLFIEGAKNRVYPPLKMIDNMLTPSTIRYQAGTKWKVKQQNAVEAMQFGEAPLQEFQATFAALSSIQQNMFGTSTTEITEAQGGPMAGKTPAALKMQAARENARDTWDRFMHEKATEELFEGMLNLLTVKMEKPINFAVFEEDIKALGYVPKQEAVTDPSTGQIIQAPVDEQKVEGLTTFDNRGSAGKMTLDKKALASSQGYRYLIDSNSSMKQNEEEQFQALMATWEMMHPTPMGPRQLSGGTLKYDEDEHAKSIFIAAGITDWDRILQEVSPAQAMAQATQQPQPAQPGMVQPGAVPPGAQQALPMPAGAPPQAPPQPGPQPISPPAGAPGFQDPAIASVAQQLLSGAPAPPQPQGVNRG